MTGLLIMAVLIAIAFFVLVALKGKGGSAEFPYQLNGPLLSKAERSFYGSLVKAVGDDGLVFSKVRVADVLSPEKGLERSTWQRAFNAISSKHFDFVVCDPGTLSVMAGIELDDASHGSKKAQKRDHFLNRACESAALPLMRVKASRGYVIADLRSQFLAVVGKAEAIAAEEPSAGPEQMAEAVEAEPTTDEAPEPAQEPKTVAESPQCPKCGAEMVRRKAKSGDNAGQEFWGCSTFPKCRSIRPLHGEPPEPSPRSAA